MLLCFVRLYSALHGTTTTKRPDKYRSITDVRLSDVQVELVRTSITRTQSTVITCHADPMCALALQVRNPDFSSRNTILALKETLAGEGAMDDAKHGLMSFVNNFKVCRAVCSKNRLAHTHAQTHTHPKKLTLMLLLCHVQTHFREFSAVSIEEFARLPKEVARIGHIAVPLCCALIESIVLPSHTKPCLHRCHSHTVPPKAQHHATTLACKTTFQGRLPCASAGDQATSMAASVPA